MKIVSLTMQIESFFKRSCTTNGLFKPPYIRLKQMRKRGAKHIFSDVTS